MIRTDWRVLRPLYAVARLDSRLRGMTGVVRREALRGA